MDVQIRTDKLVDVLLALHSVAGFRQSEAESQVAITIVTINENFTILGNVTSRQIRFLDKCRIDWEYKNAL